MRADRQSCFEGGRYEKADLYVFVNIDSVDDRSIRPGRTSWTRLGAGLGACIGPGARFGIMGVVAPLLLRVLLSTTCCHSTTISGRVYPIGSAVRTGALPGTGLLVLLPGSARLLSVCETVSARVDESSANSAGTTTRSQVRVVLRVQLFQH